MISEQTKRTLLKLAKNAFERACTLRENQRIELYLQEGTPTLSEPLEAHEALVYGPSRILCYQIFGHDHLEAEIKAWIDQERIIHQPTPEHPVQEPTESQKSIRELERTLAQKRGIAPQEVSSYEIFANLSASLIEQIESSIIAYWWEEAEGENGKNLAKAQIDEALSRI
ncbi:MAG: hypothetical protein JXK05_11875 [Campylobacterales bacterium]|nr:hypothetical protein [Campylobacterales bacterium]